jgi:hypothetical protein
VRAYCFEHDKRGEGGKGMRGRTEMAHKLHILQAVYHPPLAYLSHCLAVLPISLPGCAVVYLRVRIEGI